MTRTGLLVVPGVVRPPLPPQVATGRGGHRVAPHRPCWVTTMRSMRASAQLSPGWTNRARAQSTTADSYRGLWTVLLLPPAIRQRLHHRGKGKPARASPIVVVFLLCDLVQASSTPMRRIGLAFWGLGPKLARRSGVGSPETALLRAAARHRHRMTTDGVVMAIVAAGRAPLVRDKTPTSAFPPDWPRMLRHAVRTVRHQPLRASHLTVLVPTAAVGPGAATCGRKMAKRLAAADVISGGLMRDRWLWTTWTPTSTPGRLVVASPARGMILAATTTGEAHAGRPGPGGARRPPTTDGTARAIAVTVSAGLGTTCMGATAGMTAAAAATAPGAATVGAGVAAAVFEGRSHHVPTGQTMMVDFLAGVAA